MFRFSSPTIYILMLATSSLYLIYSFFFSLIVQAMFISASDGYPMPFEEPEDWSEEFHDFITHCLQCDPTERWTVPQLLEVLFFHTFPFYRHH